MSDGHTSGANNKNDQTLPIGRRDILRTTGAGFGITGFVGQVSGASGLDVNIRQINRPEFPEVTVFASVYDSNGDTLSNLSKSDFNLIETRLGSSSDQAIETLSSPDSDEANNISTAIVIDKSRSMSTGSRMETAIEGGKEFVQQFNSGDEGLVLAFNESTEIRQRWTSSQSGLTDTIDSISPAGNTALFDAVREGVNEAGPRTDQEQIGRSAVVVLADGQDNASSSSLSEAVNIAKQEGVPVYTIGLGNTINYNNLEQLATETGGGFYEAADGSDLTEIYTKIAESIANEYEITYVTNDDTTDGAERKVRLETAYNGLSGYDTETFEEPCAPLPTASFTFSPDAVVEGQEVSFDGSASQPNGGQLVEYEWDFNNDGSVNSYGETATHTYTEPGQYNIALAVEKTCGARDVEVKSIAVADEPVSVVNVNTNAPITEGEVLEAEVELKNTRFDKENRSVALQDFSGSTVDIEPIQIGREESLTLTLEWDTEAGDAGTDNISIQVSDIEIKEQVEIEKSYKSRKLQTAQLIDQQSSHSAMEGYLNTKLDGDKEWTASTITALDQAADQGQISESTRVDAIQRLQAVEDVSLRTIQRIGPAQAKNSSRFINISENTAVNTLKTAVNIMGAAVAIAMIPSGLGVLAGGAATVAAGFLTDIATDTINDMLAAGEDNDGPGLAQEATRQCKEKTTDLFTKVSNGEISGGEAIQQELTEIADEIIDLVQDGIRTAIEIDTIQGIFNTVGSVGGYPTLLGNGYSIYGTLNDVDNAFQPDKLAAEGLQGDTEKIIQELERTENNLDSTIKDAADLMEFLETVSGELNLWDNIEDALTGDQEVIWQIIDSATALGNAVVGLFLDVLTSAGSTVVGYSLMAYIKLMQGEITRTAINGEEVTFPNV
ncbi:MULTISPECIES: VWA domain-containing protein [Halolamina]|uniref:VWFA-related domain-containing protein n=2 Tax=Halolamina TaxID=1075397 RepID=A0A1I5VTF9_9EURY|nr:MULTISPECIES: VWA domain-containing protein [Halolamina]NHX37856.1 VWA domain-containing protein [Halolamina sp. R1-12]SFQ10741.1 VWFA-related domain-containing protein [Halolamina pelagica]